MSIWTAEAKVGGWFTMVEVEVNSRCNRQCRYCPNSTILPNGTLPELMPDAVFCQVLAELSRIGYEGRMSFHFYGEPLLHPNILEIVHAVSERLPRVRQVLYTNGDYLSDGIYEALVRNGVERFIVTSHDGHHIPARPSQVVLLPSDLVLTNRGGSVSVGTPPRVHQPLSIPCFAPSSLLVVTVTGDVLLCYEDAQRKQRMGNICQEHVEDIWFGERFSTVRALVAAGRRNATPVCEVCNNVSHPSAETYDYRP